MRSMMKNVNGLLTDEEQPLSTKRAVLAQLVMDDSKESEKLLAKLLNGSARPSEHEEKTEVLKEMITAMEEGPVRTGTFLAEVTAEGFHGPRVPRVEVVLPDGQLVYAVVPDPGAVGKLCRGDTVYLDAQAKAVLGRQPGLPRVGEQARLVRQIDEATVEVDLDHQGRFIFRSSEKLAEDLAAGKVEPGYQIVVCPNRHMAFDGVPPAQDNAHFHYLDRSPPPDVLIERDIANPPAYIEETLNHVRREMLEPTLARTFRLNRLRTVFLTGVSGTGKTLSIEGFARAMYELIAQVTGLSLDAVPPRVLRLRASQILTKWFGESESNVDKFFNEVEALSEEPVRGADGVEYEAPVLVIAEEIDGLTRERGSGDATDGRVQNTILQRLDATAKNLRDRLIIVICTSNVPSLLDPAFVRRAGGMIEPFGRLGRQSFVAVLRKHLRDIPFVPSSDAEEPRDAAIAALTAWLFGRNADKPVTELVYAGSTQAQQRYRRDFLTGSIVERAVQQAATRACRIQEQGGDAIGLSQALLAEAFVDQIGKIVEQLTEQNVHHYLTVPRGSRVATVRPSPEPSPTPFELERSA